MVKSDPNKKPRNRRSVLKFVLWGVVTVMLIFATSEGAARLYIYSMTPPPPITIPSTPPPPYKNASYWSPEFMKALQDETVYHSGTETLCARLTVSQPLHPL